MKRIFKTYIIAISLVINTTIATEVVLVKDDLCEQLRAGNVYEQIDLSKLPFISSAAECIQLCESLIKSDIRFWKEHQEQMREFNS